MRPATSASPRSPSSAASRPSATTSATSAYAAKRDDEMVLTPARAQRVEVRGDAVDRRVDGLAPRPHHRLVGVGVHVPCAHDAALAVPDVGDLAQPARDAVALARARPDRLAEARGDVAQRRAAAQQRLAHRVRAVGEVAVERAVRHARFVRDRAGGERFGIGGREQPRDGVEQAIARAALRGPLREARRRRDRRVRGRSSGRARAASRGRESSRPDSGTRAR